MAVARAPNVPLAQAQMVADPRANANALANPTAAAQSPAVGLVRGAITR